MVGAAACGPAIGSGRNIVPVRQMRPLWRRDAAGRGDGRVATEAPARKILGADGVGEREVLAIPGDIDDVGIVRVDDDREVDGPLPTGLLRGIQTDNVPIRLLGQGQVHRRPRGAQVTGIPDVLRLPVDQNGCVQPPVAGDRHFGVIVSQRDDGLMDPSRARVIDGDIRPTRPRIGAAKDADSLDRRVENIRVVRIADQVVDGPEREAIGPGGERPGRPAVGAPQQPATACKRVRRRQHRVAPCGHTRYVSSDQERIGQLRPRVSAVVRKQQTSEIATFSVKCTEVTDAGDQCLMARIHGIELHRTDRERCKMIGQWRPSHAGRTRVVRAPDAAVDGSRIENVRVGRVGEDSMNRADYLVVRQDVFDLAVGHRPRTLRHPRGRNAQKEPVFELLQAEAPVGG